MNPPTPEHTEAWLSTGWTWLLLLGVFLLLAVVVRLIADFLDRRFPAPGATESDDLVDPGPEVPPEPSTPERGSPPPWRYY